MKKDKYDFSRLNLSCNHRRCTHCGKKAFFWANNRTKTTNAILVCFSCAQQIKAGNSA